MKKHIKFLAILFSASIFLYSACCEHDDDDDAGYCSEEGIILSPDFRDCACCGGWFIEIGNDTLRANNLPQEFVASFDFSDLPLPVYLEWSTADPLCLGDEILVPCVRRR